MRQILLVLTVLLLGLSWAVAQDASAPGASGQNSAGANGKTVTGCLSGSGGNFTLTDKHGTSYQLTGDTAKLSQHVGHEVKVTGTPSASASAGAASTPAGGGGAQQSLEVTSIKHISKTCQAGAGGMTH
jgi:hypothetical protein